MDSTEPGGLRGREAACGCLDLDAGEYGNALADHLRGDGDGAPADEVSGATGKAELNGAACAGIWELADLITE